MFAMEFNFADADFDGSDALPIRAQGNTINIPVPAEASLVTKQKKKKKVAKKRKKPQKQDYHSY